MHALLAALLNHLKLVVITLSENDDAQVIFETLNSQAEPLLAIDLVRNNIFQRASSQGESAEALFDAKWKPFDQDGTFWKADSPRAKPKRPRIDHFLSHALTAQTGAETSLKELYAEYRDFTRPKGKTRFGTVGEELDALTVYRPIYRTLEVGGGDPGLTRLGAKLNQFEVSTVYPLVFRVAASDASEGEKGRLYDLIYSYLVRRTICGLTPKNLNKTFARIVSDMIRDGVSVETFLSSFTGQRGDTVRFPGDDDFKTAFVHAPAYELTKRKERLAEILWDLECASRSKYSVDTARPDSMSVEHVLPQTWMTHWPLPDGRMAPADRMSGADQPMLAAIRARDAALHTMGNLTLVTVPGNTSASNRAFPDKRRQLRRSATRSSTNGAIAGFASIGASFEEAVERTLDPFFAADDAVLSGTGRDAPADLQRRARRHEAEGGGTTRQEYEEKNAWHSAHVIAFSVDCRCIACPQMRCGGAVCRQVAHRPTRRRPAKEDTARAHA